MPDYIQLARDILRDLLANGPRKGAPLKTLLAREFHSRAGQDFNAVFRKFPKFSAFLAAHSDLVEFRLPTGPGDIMVFSKQSAEAGLTREIRMGGDGHGGVRFRMPSPLWHAFTNPDPMRRRFFHRLMRNVVHFVEGSPAEPNVRIAQTVTADRNYVEIRPVTAEQQNQWMREFTQTHEIPHGKGQLVDSLLTVPFTSQLNKVFCTALGELGEQWSSYRTRKVQEHVAVWAAEKGVLLDSLLGTVAALDERSGVQPFGAVASNTHADSDLRRILHLAIDSLEPAELAYVLLPAAALSKLTKLGAR